MQMNRREVLAGAMAGMGMLAMPQLGRVLAASAAKKGINVLWIGTDDLRCALGCYGHEEIRSPNLDALARRGVMFRNAYVQQAVCAASRASFLTGCRPLTTTVDYPYNKFFIDEFLPKHPSLPKYFFDRGYHTLWGGKIHHGSSYDMKSLSGRGLATGKIEPWWQNYALPENRAKVEASQKDKSVKAPPYEMADAPDDAYADGRLADGTVLALREAVKLDKPFFLTPGFVRPHLPFCCPKKYWDLYDRRKIKLADAPRLPAGAPPFATATFELPTYEGGFGAADKPVPEDLAITLRHGYYACTSFIDAQVGKILDEVERLRLWDNTVIMFWSDHGFHLGDQGAWGKHMNYEWSTHAPLIVWAPGMKGNGKASDALVEYVDMFPTLCDLAGLEKPDYLEGTSLSPLLEDPARPWKSAVFGQYPRKGGLEGFAIRSERYRYVEWRTPDETGKAQVTARELYDHREDPHESRNAADDHPEVAKDLSARLDAGWKAALPK